MFWIISNASVRYAETAGEMGNLTFAVADELTDAVLIAVAVALREAVIEAVGIIIGVATCCGPHSARIRGVTKSIQIG